MKNLKLISKLQSSEMVTLILQEHPGEQLDYFIVSRSINYSIVASGQCEGSLQGNMCTFNILLSSLYPLLDKGYTFRIRYNNDLLEFVSPDERLRLTPLCVQYEDANTRPIVEKFMRMQKALNSDQDLGTQIGRAEAELREAQQRYDGVSRMKLEGAMTGSNPFGDVEDLVPSEELSKAIEEKRLALTELRKRSEAVKKVDLKAFKTLALAASRAHEVINFCDDFAVVSLKNTFILQKGTCPAMSVQGPILHQLMSYSGGDGFYWFENGLAYTVGDTEKTTIFMEKCLPNTTVDGSIVKRGATLERYQLSMKGILAVTQLMKSKFPQMTFDMGEGQVVLENDKGEHIITKFEVEDTKTVQLKKLMRGEKIQGEFTQAMLSIPLEVQSLLSLFRDKMIVYVKERKVIFQSEDLYVVFGR